MNAKNEISWLLEKQVGDIVIMGEDHYERTIDDFIDLKPGEELSREEIKTFLSDLYTLTARAYLARASHEAMKADRTSVHSWIDKAIRNYLTPEPYLWNLKTHTGFSGFVDKIEKYGGLGVNADDLKSLVVVEKMIYEVLHTQVTAELLSKGKEYKSSFNENNTEFRETPLFETEIDRNRRRANEVKRRLDYLLGYKPNPEESVLVKDADLRLSLYKGLKSLAEIKAEKGNVLDDIFYKRSNE